MTLADLGAVLTIEVQAYGHPWTHGNFVDSLAAGHLAEVLEGEEGRIAGYFIAMDGVDELHLLNLDRAGRPGRGHSSALLETVLAHARARPGAGVARSARQQLARARRSTRGVVSTRWACAAATTPACAGAKTRC
ncbi:MAG: ribosomal-protein-alanine N-acetyltransferase [Rubrivivax sp.]